MSLNSSASWKPAGERQPSGLSSPIPFVLVEAPHLLAPEGSTRMLAEVLAGADQGSEVVADQKFVVRRTTCEDGRVAVEADWSATVLMDLRYGDGASNPGPDVLGI
jgi:hypothetical protein